MSSAHSSLSSIFVTLMIFLSTKRKKTGICVAAKIIAFETGRTNLPHMFIKLDKLPFEMACVMYIFKLLS